MNRSAARLLTVATTLATAGATVVTGLVPLATAGATPASTSTTSSRASTTGTSVSTGRAATSRTAGPARATGRPLAVPQQFRTISAAVAAARNGDTVFVSPGAYRESVQVNGKYITIRATDPNPLRTTIIGQRGRSAVEISNVPTAPGGVRARLTGFHLLGTSSLNGLGGGLTLITRGDAVVENNIIERCSTSYGGGILVFRYSSPIIQNNNIRFNHASQGGGGIMIGSSSSPTVYRNTIQHNTASGGRIPGGGASGAGMFIAGNGDSTPPARASAPQVLSNEISGNNASFAGGGVFLGYQTNARLDLNHIASNRSSYGGGIHIENHGATPIISRNTIEHNEAPRSAAFPGSGSGGGVSIFGESRPNLQHNLIYANGTSWVGGGIVVAEQSVATINGNRLRANVVRDASINGASGGGLFIAQSRASMTNNLIWQNRAPNGGGVAATGVGSLQLYNNVLIYNQAGTAIANRTWGGGLYVGSGSSIAVAVNNNIFAGNNAYQIAQAASQPTYSHNLITNNGNGVFMAYATGPLSDARQLNGNRGVRFADYNISNSPSFGNPLAGDVHLRPGSPGINQGRNSAAPTIDFDGRRRPVARITDMGIYEQ